MFNIKMSTKVGEFIYWLGAPKFQGLRDVGLKLQNEVAYVKEALQTSPITTLSTSLIFQVFRSFHVL